MRTRDLVPEKSWVLVFLNVNRKETDFTGARFKVEISKIIDKKILIFKRVLPQTTLFCCQNNYFRCFCCQNETLWIVLCET